MDQGNKEPALIAQHENRLLMSLFTLEAVPRLIEEMNRFCCVGVGFDFRTAGSRGIVLVPPAGTGKDDVPVLSASFNKVCVWLWVLFSKVNNWKECLKKDSSSQIKNVVEFTVSDFARFTGQEPHRARQAIDKALSVLGTYTFLFYPDLNSESVTKLRMGTYEKESRSKRLGAIYRFRFDQKLLDYLRRAGTKPLFVPHELFAINDRRSQLAFKFGMMLLHDSRNRSGNIRGSGKLTGQTILERLPFERWTAESRHGFRFRKLYLTPVINALKVLEDCGLFRFSFSLNTKELSESETKNLTREEFCKACLTFNRQKKGT